MKLFEAKKMSESRKAEARARLKKLRVDMADDTEVDPDEVAQIMRDAGTDFEELERQVGELKRRREMVAKIEESKRNFARAAKIDEQIGEAEAAFAGVLQKHQQQVAGLQSQKVGLTDHYPAHNAELSLRRGATDPDLRAAKEELARERAALVKQQQGIEYQYGCHRESVAGLNSEIARQQSLHATPNPRLAREIELHDGKAKVLKQKIELVREAAKGLDAPGDELRLRELDPNSF